MERDPKEMDLQFLQIRKMEIRNPLRCNAIVAKSIHC